MSENREFAHGIVRILRRNLDIDDVGRRMLRKILFERFQAPGTIHLRVSMWEMLCAFHPKT